MTPRMNIFKAAPEGTRGLMAIEAAIEKSDLEHGLIALVKLRASQINGCPFCIYMHVGEALKHGESDMRLHLLDAWRDSPAFTDRERAALTWTEVLTRVSPAGVADDDYELLKQHFDEIEIAYLTLAIAAINAWNRVQIGLRAVHPALAAKAAA